MLRLQMVVEQNMEKGWVIKLKKMVSKMVQKVEKVSILHTMLLDKHRLELSSENERVLKQQEFLWDQSGVLGDDIEFLPVFIRRFVDFLQDIDD